MNIKQYFPLAEQLVGYNGSLFRGDVIAGLTVWILLVPQAMAYALLAGMPPIYGLYGGLVPLVIYGLLGTSRQLSIGPVAVSALLVLAGVSKLATPESPEFVQYVILTGFTIGVLQVLLSALRLGFLVTFLSHPVILGFTAAAAVIIAVSQLKYMMGIEIPRFEQTYETAIYALQHIGETHWLTFAVCTGSIVLMVLIKKKIPALPGALFVSVLGIVATAVFRLNEQGLEVVGVVPEGLPAFLFPDIQMSKILAVLPTVFTVAAIGIVESIGIAKALELKNKDCKVRPDQELLALGTAKVVGSFFQSLPTSASFTRSAINSEAGAKTGIASIVAAIATGLTLLFLTPLFFYLPKAVLGAIVLMAVTSLVDIPTTQHLWKVHRRDFFMLVITFIATLTLGIEAGVLTGVVLSLLAILYQSSRPHIAILGQLPNTMQFRNVKRFPDAIQHEGILIARFDAPLYFLNVEHFKAFVTEKVAENEPRLFILDASSIIDIDSGGLDALEEMHDYLVRTHCEFYITGLLGPVRDTIHISGLSDKLGADHQFLNIYAAVQHFAKGSDPANGTWSEAVLQFNYKNNEPTI